ncbi:Peptidoglycan/xylan/chitin deacetylase, PgdA/CDA1 family [Actinacidiphila rubida]|uniref:Peptidoglycan/xylan/chitin deacetylase, PgdA/CDA1 family n=2 Tax=Actinacidiphila rubida TaxID=310780 RepID=A0A1H8U392_9ACTN|nr:Peptidoglycan/xylan/chitin deacetylase, PgdA/CDA1 family [Actinacidiphila rubida]
MLARLRSAPQWTAAAAAFAVIAVAAVTTALVAPGSPAAAAHAGVPHLPGVPAGKDGGPSGRPTASGGSAHAPAHPAAPPVPDTIVHAAEISGPAVNITIDDGPDPVWTPKVLAVLRKHHVHAVFCMIGPQAAAHPDLVRQVVAEGHRLCDHTVHHDTGMDHKPFAYQKSEIMDALQMIETASGGARVSYYRAPGGAFTPASRALAAQHGMRPLGWNVDTKDFDRPGTQVIVNTVKSEIHNGPTILFHDGGGQRAQTVAALDQALTWIKGQGYAFSFPKVD